MPDKDNNAPIYITPGIFKGVGSSLVYGGTPSAITKPQPQKKVLTKASADREYYEKRSRLNKLGTTTDVHGVYSSNLFFDKNIDWYSRINRYGWIDPFDTDRITREFLFFTKPDLNLFDGDNVLASQLVDELYDNVFFKEVANRMPNILTQLTKSVPDPDGRNNPFMYLLSNAVTSKLDLPSISAESQESTQNIMGTSIQYRGHSLKSDNGYDFSLSFTDTAYLEIYTLVKCYDEYMRLLRLGYCSPKHEYITARIIPEQFSIYKFLIGSDGETIIYYAKLTGCYFTDVPRSDMADPGDEVKFSLSFHAQFVEDMNPQILEEFNKLTSSCYHYTSDYMKVYRNDHVNNEWARYPAIVKAYRSSNKYGKRVDRRHVNYDYFLKWWAA